MGLAHVANGGSTRKWGFEVLCINGSGNYGVTSNIKMKAIAVKRFEMLRAKRRIKNVE